MTEQCKISNLSKAEKLALYQALDIRKLRAGYIPNIDYKPSLAVKNHLSKLCGIISYLPDEVAARAERFRRCINLIEVLDEKFKLPICMVCQNWRDSEIESIQNNVTNSELFIFRYDKLGIVGARKELRRLFLEEFTQDCIILLEDDSVIEATDRGVENYLLEIDAHPDMFGVFKYSFPRLMVMPRACYKNIDYDFILNADPSLGPDAGGIWDDHCLVHTFANIWPDKIYRFSCFEIAETSPYSEHDPFSIWYNGQDQNMMGVNSDIVLAQWVEYLKNKREA